MGGTGVRVIEKRSREKSDPIAGYCPGPGITALVLGIPNPVLFIMAFILGSLAYQWYAELSVKSDRIEQTQVK